MILARRVVARYLQATAFPTEEALKKYLQKHPKADPAKHTVSKGKGEAPKGEAPKGEKPKGEKPKDEAPKGEKPKDEAPKGEKPKDEAPKGKQEEAPKKLTRQEGKQHAEWLIKQIDADKVDSDLDDSYQEMVKAVDREHDRDPTEEEIAEFDKKHLGHAIQVRDVYKRRAKKLVQVVNDRLKELDEWFKHNVSGTAEDMYDALEVARDELQGRIDTDGKPKKGESATMEASYEIRVLNEHMYTLAHLVKKHF